MVYVGLGVLAASISFLIYRYGFPNKLPPCHQRSWVIWVRNFRLISSDISYTNQQSICDEASPIADDEESIKSQDLEANDDTNIPPMLSRASEPKIKIDHFVPILTLDHDNDDSLVAKTEPQISSTTEDVATMMLQNQWIGAKQARQQSAMGPPARPSRTQGTKSQILSDSLMPPPSPQSAKNPALRPLPRLPTSLQPPPSAASALRTPPSRPPATPTPSLQPSTSTLSPSKRPSKKVVLDPGHSPLDWAYLVKNPPTPTFLRGALVPPNLIRVSPSLLRHQNGRKGKDAWGVWQGRVYNLTPYMKFHPGGDDELMKAAGREKDGERLFLEVHPWVSWESMLGECLIGILVGEDEAIPSGGNGDSHLEEMD